MTIGLSADSSRLQDAGQELLSAAVANQRPYAQLTYTWTLDGQTQSETSDTLSLSGIQPGSHTVTVSATDTKNNLGTDSASNTFTRNPAGTTCGAGEQRQLGVPGGTTQTGQSSANGRSSGGLSPAVVGEPWRLPGP
jgi:hypothetical protein